MLKIKVLFKNKLYDGEIFGAKKSNIVVYFGEHKDIWTWNAVLNALNKNIPLVSY